MYLSMYPPPVDMPMNGTGQIWATIVTGGLATLMFAGALWEMRRTRSPFLLFSAHRGCDFNRE